MIAASTLGNPSVLALFAAFMFGLALVLTQFGLRCASPLHGALVSIPTAAAFLWILAPLLLDWRNLSPVAAVIFAAVGLFFPSDRDVADVRGQSSDGAERVGRTRKPVVSICGPFSDDLLARRAKAAPGIWDRSDHCRGPYAINGSPLAWRLMVVLGGRTPDRSSGNSRFHAPNYKAGPRRMAKPFCRDAHRLHRLRRCCCEHRHSTPRRSAAGI